MLQKLVQTLMLQKQSCLFLSRSKAKNQHRLHPISLGICQPSQTFLLVYYTINEQKKRTPLTSSVQKNELFTHQVLIITHQKTEHFNTLV